MRFTEATLLNRVVRVQRFVDINDKTLDAIDQSEGRKRLEEVVEHFSSDTVNQTSAKHAVAADSVQGSMVCNARRLVNMRRNAATVPATCGPCAGSRPA